MKAFFKYLWIQFKTDLRDKGNLLNYYLVPLAFYFVMGAVFSSITPLMKSTLAASMTIFAVTMGAVMGSPTALVRMRESGTLRAFKVNGISGSAVLCIQAISTFIHLFIVATLIYLITPLAYHGDVPASIPAYFGIVTVLLLANIGIGLLIGVVAPSLAYSTMLSMLVFLPSLMLSGIMFPASMLPSALRWTGRIFPATFAMQSFYGLAYHQPTDLDPLVSLIVIGALALAVFILAFWRLNSLSKTEQR
jgi:ABC-type multidrug transport system, permease component